MSDELAIAAERFRSATHDCQHAIFSWLAVSMKHNQTEEEVKQLPCLLEARRNFRAADLELIKALERQEKDRK